MTTKAKTRKAKQKELTTLEKALKEKSPSLAEGVQGVGKTDKQAIKSKIQALKKEIAKLKEIEILKAPPLADGESPKISPSLAEGDKGGGYQNVSNANNAKCANADSTHPLAPSAEGGGTMDMHSAKEGVSLCHTERVARSISNDNKEIFRYAQYDKGVDSSLTPLTQNDNKSAFLFEIPKSWAWVKLGDICEISSGESIKLNNQPPVIARERSNRSNPQKCTQKIDCHESANADSRNDKLPILDVKYLRNKIAKIYANSGNMVCKNDRLILMDGENSGEVFIANENGFLGSTLKKLDYSVVIKIAFADFLLLHYKDFFKNNKKGAAIPHLDRKLFANLKVPLPPLNEQESIAKELDALFAISKGLRAE